MYSKNTDQSLEECRRVQTNADESQTNADECRRVQTSHQINLEECRHVTKQVWTSVYGSLDDYRQIQTSVDESKLFTLILENVYMVPFSCCCNYAPVGHIGMQILNFRVSFPIIAHHSVLTSDISKTHLPISSLNVR